MKNIFTILLAFVFGFLPSGSVFSQNVKVYETLGAFEGPIENAIESTKLLMQERGLEVLSELQAGMQDGCSFPAAVISYVDPESSSDLIQIDAKTAPYALVNRIVLFEDEAGGHIAFVNPLSIYRTVFQDNAKSKTLAQEHRAKVRRIFGTTQSREYGQARSKGLIGKTMGVMAGGPFDKKIESLVVLPQRSVAEVAAQIEERFSASSGKWGLEIGFRYDVNELNATIFGVAGREMEAKSFSIVGAGSDESRGDYVCPGTAYAAAYPLEMVVMQVDADVHIQFVSAMFRMKMYFEDAGKWAFMKNMSMTGSLAGEMKDRIEAATMSR